MKRGDLELDHSAVLPFRDEVPGASFGIATLTIALSRAVLTLSAVGETGGGPAGKDARFLFPAESWPEGCHSPGPLV